MADAMYNRRLSSMSHLLSFKSQGSYNLVLRFRLTLCHIAFRNYESHTQRQKLALAPDHVMRV